MNFSPKRAGEIEVFTVDFAAQLAPGETIVSAVWSNSVYSGADPAAASMIYNSSTVSGTLVSQLISAGVRGVVYSPICTATTSAGQVLVLPEPGEGLLTIKG